MGKKETKPRVKGNMAPAASSRAAELLASTSGSGPAAGMAFGFGAGAAGAGAGAGGAGFGSGFGSGAAAGTTGAGGPGYSRGPPALAFGASSAAAATLAFGHSQFAALDLGGASTSRAASASSSGSGAGGAGGGAGAMGDDHSHQSGLHPDLRVILKKLAKRDTTTKLKALDEFNAFVAEHQDAADLQSLVPTWPSVYCRLIVDPDRRIREAMARLHAAIARLLQKQLAPILKDIIGPWMLAHYDPSKEVARLSADTFETTFPNKRSNVVQFCQSAIVSYVSSNILDQTPETMSDPRFTTPEDMASKFSRVVAASFDILGGLVELLTKENMALEQDQYDALFSNSHFWARSGHEYPAIRRSCYVFIKTCLLNMPDIVEKHLDLISSTFLAKAFLDKTPSTHADLWNAVLLLTRQFPASWKLASAKKSVLGRLIAFLSNGAYGSVSASYPCLLPLLGNLPMQMIKENDAAFCKDFFAAFWKGLDAVERPFATMAVDAYFECLLFLITRSSQLPEAAALRLMHTDAFRPLLAHLFPFKQLTDAKTRLRPEDVESVFASFLLRMWTSQSVTDHQRAQFKTKLDEFVSLGVSQSMVHLHPQQSHAQDYQPELLDDSDMEAVCARLAGLTVAIDKAAQSLPGGATPAFTGFFSSTVCSIVQHAISGISRHAKQAAPAATMATVPGSLASLIASLMAHFGTAIIASPPAAAAVLTFLSGDALDAIRSNAASPFAMSLLAATTSVFATVCSIKPDALWDSLMDAVFDVPDDQLKLRVLHSIVTKPTKSALATIISTNCSLLDSLVEKTVSEGNPSKSPYAAECIAAFLRTTPDESILSDRAIHDVISTIKTTLMSASLSYLVVRNKHSHASHSLRPHILNNCLSPLPPLTRHLTPHLFSLVSPIFLNVIDLGIFHPASVATFAWEPAWDASTEQDMVLSSIASTAKNIWPGMAAVVKHVGGHMVRSALEQWLQQWAVSFSDPFHCGSPSDFVAQIKTLLDLLADKDSRSVHYRIIEGSIQSRDVWTRASTPFIVVDERLAIVDPIFALVPTDPALLGYAANAASTASTAATKSPLVRTHGLFMIGLIKDKVIDTNVMDAGVVWIWVELVRFANVCDTINACNEQRAAPWSSDCIIPHKHLSQEIHMLLVETIKRSTTSLREMAKETIQRIKQSPSPSPSETAILAVAALDNSLVSSLQQLHRFEYARAYFEIMKAIFAKAHFSSDDDASAWIQADAILQLREDGYATSIALLMALASQAKPVKAAGPLVKSLVDALSKVEKSSLGAASSQMEAYKLLVRLNGIAINPSGPTYVQKQSNVLTPDQAALLQRRIRMWFDGDLPVSSATPAMPANAPTPAPVATEFPASSNPCLRNHTNAQSARLLLLLVRVSPPGIAMTKFLVDLVHHWLGILAHLHAPPRAPAASETLLLYHVLALWQELRDMSSVNPKDWAYVADMEGAISATCLQLLMTSCSDLDKDLPTPIVEIQSLLCDLVVGVDLTVSGNAALVPTNKLYPMLYSRNINVQRTAWSMLHRLTKVAVQTRSLAIEMGAGQSSSSQGLTEDEDGDHDGSADSEVEDEGDEADTADTDAAGPDAGAALMTGLLRRVSQDDHSHLSLGYLLSWIIAYDFFYDATFQLKTGLTTHLRQSDSLSQFLGFIFGVLGVGTPSRMPFDLSGWDFETYEVDGFDAESDASLPLLCAHLYWRTLRCVPSLVRVWWSECRNRQLTLAVESFTERFFSPRLLQTEMMAVQNLDATQFEDLSVRVAKSSAEVTASYEIEEAVLEMVIRLPMSFPLRLVEVESGTAGGKAAGVSEARWRAWLLGVSSVMVAQNGSILDALTVFKKNVTLHFEGIEDCAICYSVIGVIDRSLPTKQCKTCKHIFHGSCLFKWFKSSNQNTCPLCRQPF
ncbi:hypothetical protein BC831DRAFT_459131 [Entophlyctis helioformis]|nr:hypothetical protein BC831DRAFT_459131 [Entophlyctis helioformis]